MRRQQTTKRKYAKCQKRKKQRGSFLTRYDFAYASRETFNQVGKIAPRLIKNASSQISKIKLTRL